MSQAIFRIDRPTNEPVSSFAAGSPEKLALKAALKQQSHEMVAIPVCIGGERLYTDHVVPVVMPHNHGHVIAECHQAQPEHVARAIKATADARREWAALPWYDRAAVFLKAADLLATKWRPTMNAATMLGQSKTCFQAEIDAACELIDFLRFNAHFMTKIYQEQPDSQPRMWNRSEARGLEGFVYAITPFNFTSIAVNLAAAPALMGCSVIWKPALTASYAGWVGMQLLEEAGLPPGVINFVPGDAPQISQTLLPHKDLAGIHFTGSTATFNYLWQEVGKNVGNYATYPRVVGETGGKDFVFAHESADPEELKTALLRGAFEYQGQKCSAASRAYIPKSLWAEIRDDLVAQTNGIKMGDIEDFSNFVGAVIDERSYDKITGYIKAAAAASDAEVIAGGEYDKSQGYFVRPTIIETSNPHYPSLVEEIFGPVLTVYPYDEGQLAATLELCDKATPYALTGAIFAKDRRVIHQLSGALSHAAGNFYINDKPTGAVVGQQPFGGSRASGTNDKAGSVYNLLRWVSFRTIKENFAPITDYRYPHMAEK